MAKEQQDKRNGLLIKIYLFILFLAGIILGLSYLAARRGDAVLQQGAGSSGKAAVVDKVNKSGKTDKNRQDENKTKPKEIQTEEKDILLDNNLITALTSNGIEQQNVVSQYVKEIKDKDKGTVYNQYYKEIKLNSGQKPENFEPILKTLARNFKIDLSKTKYKDGSYKYSFYDKKRIYSEVVLK